MGLKKCLCTVEIEKQEIAFLMDKRNKRMFQNMKSWHAEQGVNLPTQPSWK